MAAELIDGGIDVHAIYRRLYEGIPQGKLELLARGLSNVQRYDGGLLTVTHLTLEDYRLTGADESYSEGVVDHLRSVEGTAVAGLVRDLLGDGATPKRKVSLRATDDRVDVSRDRPRPGRRRPPPRGRLLDRPGLPGAGRVPARRSSPSSCDADGVVLVDKPAGVTSHDVVAAQRRARPRRRRSGTRARSTRSPPGCCSCSSAARRACSASSWRCPSATRRWRGWAGRRPPATRGRDRARPDAARAARAADRHDPPAPAGLLGGQGRRASAPTRWRAARRGRRAPRARGRRHAVRAAVARRRPRRVRDRVLVGDLRAVADRRPRRRLLPRAAADADRAVRGRRRRPERILPLDDALGFLPPSSWTATTPGAPATAWPCRGDAGDARRPSGSRRRDGLIALAEPRGRHAQARRRLPRLMEVTWLPDAERRPRASPWASSTACTSATARSSAAPTPC